MILVIHDSSHVTYSLSVRGHASALSWGLIECMSLPYHYIIDNYLLL